MGRGFAEQSAEAAVCEQDGGTLRPLGRQALRRVRARDAAAVERIPDLGPCWRGLGRIGYAGLKAPAAARFSRQEGRWHLHIHDSGINELSDAELESAIAHALVCVHLEDHEDVLQAMDPQIAGEQSRARDAVIYDFLARYGFEVPGDRRGLGRYGIDCARLAISEAWQLELERSRHRSSHAARLAAQREDGSPPPLPQLDADPADLDGFGEYLDD